MVVVISVCNHTKVCNILYVIKQKDQNKHWLTSEFNSFASKVLIQSCYKVLGILKAQQEQMEIFMILKTSNVDYQRNVIFVNKK